MQQRDLEVGEILQINPEKAKNRMFAGCLFVVTEPKSFGAQGYVQSLGENGEPGGQAYYRPGWDELEETGGAVEWMPGRESEE